MSAFGKGEAKHVKYAGSVGIQINKTFAFGNGEPKHAKYPRNLFVTGRSGRSGPVAELET